MPIPSLSSRLPKRWPDQDSGAVGLGIVVSLPKSIVLDSPAKFNMSTAPMPITPMPAGCIKESRQQGPKSKRWKDEVLLCGLSAISRNKEIIVPALSMDFLNNCCLCRKQLHGKDVYMYQAKAFCSMECRYHQIASDEMQEKCGRTSKSKICDISCSTYSGHGRLFFTDIVAT